MNVLTRFIERNDAVRYRHQRGTDRCAGGDAGFPGGRGHHRALRATVTPPAVGSVQFMDGRATIGSPVAGSGATATVTRRCRRERTR
ncbi:MAG: hypothetical protein ACRDRQ_20580 [Pseudonocardiaceae bacterium]